LGEQRGVAPAQTLEPAGPAHSGCQRLAGICAGSWGIPGRPAAGYGPPVEWRTRGPGRVGAGATWTDGGRRRAGAPGILAGRRRSKRGAFTARTRCIHQTERRSAGYPCRAHIQIIWTRTHINHMDALKPGMPGTSRHWPYWASPALLPAPRPAAADRACRVVPAAPAAPPDHARCVVPALVRAAPATPGRAPARFTRCSGPGAGRPKGPYLCAERARDGHGRHGCASFKDARIRVS
jgi:hypothetical protein